MVEEHKEKDMTSKEWEMVKTEREYMPAPEWMYTSWMKREDGTQAQRWDDASILRWALFDTATTQKLNQIYAVKHDNAKQGIVDVWDDLYKRWVNIEVDFEKMASEVVEYNGQRVPSAKKRTRRMMRVMNLDCMGPIKQEEEAAKEIKTSDEQEKATEEIRGEAQCGNTG